MILMALKVLSILLKNSSRLSSPLSLNCRLRELDIEVKLEKYALTVSRSLELWYFMANLKSVIQGLLHKNVKLCFSILDESIFFPVSSNNLCTTLSNLYPCFVGDLGFGFFFYKWCDWSECMEANQIFWGLSSSAKATPRTAFLAGRLLETQIMFQDQTVLLQWELSQDIKNNAYL